MAMATKCVEGDGTHRLEAKNYRRPYTCYGCEELGFGLRYRCDQCSYEFHEACTRIDFTRRISHEFFPGSEFHFQLTPPNVPSPRHQTYCDACRNTIKGFVFHCEEHNLDLHPCCRKLAKTYQIKNVKFNLSKKVKGKCMRCRHQDGGKKKGWSYVSECEKYHVHVDCVTQMALDEWNNNNNNHITARTSLAVRNSRPIQRRNNGGGAGMTGEVLKFIVETIVSTVIGDPTTIIASSIIEAIINL